MHQATSTHMRLIVNRVFRDSLLTTPGFCRVCQQTTCRLEWGLESGQSSAKVVLGRALAWSNGQYILPYNNLSPFEQARYPLSRNEITKEIRWRRTNPTQQTAITVVFLSWSQVQTDIVICGPFYMLTIITYLFIFLNKTNLEYKTISKLRSRSISILGLLLVTMIFTVCQRFVKLGCPSLSMFIRICYFLLCVMVL